VIQQEKKQTILWAIYRAKVPGEVKQQLLIKYSSPEVLNTTIELCARLHFPNVLERALETIRGEQAKQQ
jgi:hypothetical protein